WRWRLRGRDTSGIDWLTQSDTDGRTTGLRAWERGSVGVWREGNQSRPALPQQPVDQTDLAEGDGSDGGPGEPLPQAQAPLAGFAEPELHLQRADFDGVAAAQYGPLNQMAIDRGERV